ncbi:PREDICTED: uncharacterized protein LOC109159482 [Ipomoea nil]|uniref:uncharacterized protein LOC109159482 n=1 Tax=Ipomoea nil TaxID=35883 RepID=UPI000901FDBC|nr:PREDICTED: uncharacterized protein LOC109159482 [Ipomoea nil]
MDEASEVWNDLKKRFSQQDAQRISSLQTEICALRQGSLIVNDYYTKCRILWEQMNDLRPLPICRCDPRCSCALLDDIKKEREVDRVIWFLQGLNDEYNSLKSGVLVLDPLPDMHKVFVIAEKYERQLNITNLTLNNVEFNHANAVQANQNTTEDVVAAVNYHNRRNNGSSSGNKAAKCTYCGMTGHTVEKCYKKHGYPPGWVQGFKSKGKQQSVTATVSNEAGSSTSEQL